MVHLLVVLGAAAGATAAAVESSDLRTHMQKEKPFFEGIGNDWRVWAAGGLVVAGAAIGGDVGRLCVAGGVGVGASVVSTEVARSYALKQVQATQSPVAPDQPYAGQLTPGQLSPSELAKAASQTQLAEQLALRQGPITAS